MSIAHKVEADIHMFNHVGGAGRSRNEDARMFVFAN
jgi:hypothetical protein